MGEFALAIGVVTPERLVKIRETAAAALEIDFSRTGGRVNRKQLRRIVVEDISLKRWLYNPLLEEAQTRLDSEVAEEVAGKLAEQKARQDAIANRKASALSAPLEVLAKEFVEAAVAMYDAFANSNSSGRPTDVQQHAEFAAKERVADIVDKMTLRGFPEAGNSEFIGDKGILSRILTCKLNRPVGYRLANVAGVLNAMWQANGWRRSYHSLTFIALAVYQPMLTPEQKKKVDDRRGVVRQSIRDGQTTYKRDPEYDGLLSILFPEMAKALAMQGGKLQEGDAPLPEQSRRRAYFLDTQPRADRASGPLQDTPPGAWWLRGRDLANWQAKQEPGVSAQFGVRTQTA